ncbi:MAG: hypothetical protein AMS17_19040 [Spirochaetes bacterium DG_61]|nr:MAG: hypothetical protein AMS17_19040 [Spirochaetes bacterium DG_61]
MPPAWYHPVFQEAEKIVGYKSAAGLQERLELHTLLLKYDRHEKGEEERTCSNNQREGGGKKRAGHIKTPV